MNRELIEFAEWNIANLRRLQEQAERTHAVSNDEQAAQIAETAKQARIQAEEEHADLIHMLYGTKH